VKMVGPVSRPPLQARGRIVTFERTRIMGIINTTPDSFSDGGDFLDPQHAIDHGKSLYEAGAEILDIGGMSTRPGATSISVSEECDRVLPVVSGLAEACPDALLSIDTFRPAVAEAALGKGAHLINDVRGLLDAPELAEVAAEFQAGLILMHSPGRSDVMQQLTDYERFPDDVLQSLSHSVELARKAGVANEALVVDPGFGFGKTWPQNVVLLKELKEFHQLELPILVGLSRKSFLGWLTDRQVPRDRDPISHAAMVLAVAAGAHIIRTHDVHGAHQARSLTNAVFHGIMPDSTTP